MRLAGRVTGLVPLLCLVAAAQDTPRVETFFGYSLVRFDFSGNAPNFTSNGGTAQLVYNFKPWFQLVGDFGGYHSGRVGAFNVDNTVANFQFGPRFSFRKKRMVSLYVQSLFGGAYGTASTQLDVTNPHGSQSTFAMLLGGGVEVKLARHVAFRPAELDYFFTRLRNPVLDTTRAQNNLRYSTGFTFLFGGERPTPPPPPPSPPAPKPKMALAMSLTAPRTEICEGETVALAPALGGAPGGVHFQWTVNGQPVSGGEQFEFGSAGRAPGVYRIGVASQGEAWLPARAETAITVREYRAPSGTVQASPAEVYAGGKATLTARFEGECGGPIGPPQFTASEGAVRENEFDSSSVAFDANAKGEQRKAVTITATAKDERGSGSAATTLTVIQPAAITAVRLPDILFQAGTARVNNCGKRVLLEQLRSYFERDPGGKAVLVGHQAESEPAKLGEQRVRNAAAVISAGTGICLAVPADQILVSAPGADQAGVGFEPNFCAASVVPERRGQGVAATDRFAEYRRVVVWFVPSGGKLPESLASHETAGALNLHALGCPK